MMAAINGGGWAALVWMIFFTPPPLEYENIPFPVVTPFVKAGEPVVVVVRRCNTAAVSRMYAVSRELVDEKGNATLLEPMLAKLPIGCATTTVRSHQVPLGTPPGRYYLRGYAEIQEFIRSHTVHWRTMSFEVVP